MTVSTHTLEVKVDVQENDALYLRTAIAEGVADDGTQIEISLSGATLILQHEAPGKEHIVHTISLTDLVRRWASSVDEAEESKTLQPGDEHDTTPERLLFGGEQAAPGSDD